MGFKVFVAKKSFCSKYDFVNYVKSKKNYFNDKTVYRTEEFLNSYIVYEYNHFSKETHLWIWVARVGDNKFIVVPTGYSKKNKRVKDIIQKAYNELQNIGCDKPKIIW